MRFNFFRQKALFKGDDQLFKSLIRNASTYIEYGSGASTIWVANNTQLTIYSTDTSEEWLGYVRQKSNRNSGFHLHWADLGPIGKWGRPLGYSRCDRFSDYTDWVWNQSISGDVILIDGRFRVCCFLTSLLYARAGSFIVFDDYGRENYHFVERFLKPFDLCGQQAAFLVPKKENLDLVLISKAISDFRHVFD